MKATTITFKYGVKRISRDYMLILLLLAPILAGAAFKYGVPIADEMIAEYLQTDTILQPYYSIFDSILIYLAPSMFCTIYLV